LFIYDLFIPSNLFSRSPLNIIALLLTFHFPDSFHCQFDSRHCP